MIRFSKLAAALAVVPVIAVSGSALADSPGQLTDNANNFMVKNLTQNGAYANNVSAACNEEVQYSVRLHNAAFGGLTNVVVKANIISGQMTAVPAEGASQGTTGTATVTMPSNGSIAYEAGSTVLHDVNGNVIKTLSDGITTQGVNVGNIAGSTTEFVNFKAKVACPPVTPPTVSLACVQLDVTNVDRTHYDFTAKGSVQNATITGYTFTAKNANGNVVDTFNNSTNSTTSGVYHFNQETGTYTVSAQLNTDHGNNSNSNCVKQITVAAAPTTPTPTPTPTAKSLPNTGAGDVLGIFGASSAFGAAAHYVNSRRNRR